MYMLPLVQMCPLLLTDFDSHQLPHGVAELVLDIFSQAFHDCLRFPASHSSLDGTPKQLKERLSCIHLQKSQVTRGSTHDALDGIIESWTATESSVRTVLTTLSPGISEHVRRRTTIYQLGFDSISAVQIGSMLRKLGHQVVASDVIEYPTCESLARHMDTCAPNSENFMTYDIAEFQNQLRSRVVAHGIAMDAVEVVNPCTPVQSAMMAQFLESGGRDYFNYIDFELEDGVSAAKLADAWRAVSLAHPVLRTAIALVEHDDCAFAMVQYSSTMFDVSTVVLSQEQTETFDLWTWREEAARTAAGIPQGRLWSVAVVEAKGKARMMHLAIHHALYDAQSLQMILNDLSTAIMGGQLTAKLDTEKAVTAILGQVFRTTESSAAFWRRQADRVVINTFPVLTPLREASGNILTESMTSIVPLTTFEEAASRAGHTLHVILQAAWARVLSAYLGEDSVVFGVVFSGRNTEVTRNAAFPCITTLPVIATNSTANHVLLNHLLQYNTELYKQQHQPLTRIQQWLGCPESRLFDTLLVYQKLDLGDSGTRPWRIVDETAGVDYPVSIEIEPMGGDQLRYQITFFGNVLSKEQAALLLNQFDATVQDLALHPTGQEAELFDACPDLFSVLPSESPEIPTTVKFLHQFLELRALENPGAPALHFVERFDGELPVGQQWTYKELDDNGNRVAQLLLPYAQPGGIVAVYFDKCPEAYFSILGILKVGCAFLALDPGAPRSRNEFILQDSGACVLVTSKQSEQDLGLKVSVLIIGISETSLALVPANPPILNRNLEPDDVCYCLYTSGTTGTPKGCEVTHDNAVQCMLAFQHIFAGHWQEDSKWLQFASLHFDVSVLEQYWSWSVGITLVAAPRDLILEDLAGTISRLDITHIDLTPSLARLLHPDDAPSLCRGVFITGGESLKQEILDVWGSKGVIYNFYGPTEATIGVTVFPRVPTTGRASNIGRQFLNVGSYVLRPGTEQPVLRGAVGELCVSGRLVGKGYLKREDLTSQKFPTLRAFGERVYRTGDLVRVLHDGCFDFIGRADDQVKLRGQRLEIGEINHTIRTGVDAVEDVATLVVRNEAQLKDLLVSFVVVVEGGKQKEATSILEIVESPEAVELCRHVRNACRSRLPGYMVPTYVLQLPFIPLSTNNKAELKELRKVFASVGQERLMALSSSADKLRQSETLSASGVKMAKVLAATQRLNVNSITLESSIFELGVDSISVLRLSRALKSAGFAHAIPSLILRHPLIGDLVAALEMQKTTPTFGSAASARQLIRAFAHKHQATVCSELDVTPDQIEYIAPCSPLQQGMISRSATDSAYFNTFQFELSPEISPESLREAFQQALDTWPILRTKFVSTTDGFVQVAMKRLLFSWSEVRIGAEASTAGAIQRTRKAWVARNQDSPIQPLEAVFVTRTGPAVLVLHIFHGLYDGNSFDLILDRVAGEYLALNREPIQHDEFISGPSFLDALCYGPLQDFSTTKAFWLEHLDGITLDSMSTRLPHPSVSTLTRTVSFGALETLRTSLRVTHQALAQAAWVSVLGKHLPSDPVIGVIVSGRNLELDDAENVVGPLFNTLPFRARTSKGNNKLRTTWASLIQQCHGFNTTVLPFQHVPLRDIQKWCSGGKPLFNTLFSFQRQDKGAARQNWLWTMVESEPSTDYPLALEVTLDSEGWLRLLLVGHEDGDDSSNSTLWAMMDMLQDAFASMGNGPDDLIWGSIANGNHEKDHAADMKGQIKNADKTNGLPAPTHPAQTPFVWTEEAAMIRNEMAALADTNPDMVTESTPLFGLGLDSIDVIKLSARLKQQGMGIKTSDLLKAQTITGILKYLQAKTHNGNNDDTSSNSKGQEFDEVALGLREHLVGLGKVDAHEIVLPTTPLQESMVVEMVASDFQVYFNHDILELAPSVDIKKLKDVWKTVIAGSPILRTRFIPVEHPSSRASYCQVIRDEPEAFMNEAYLDSTDELAKICDTATLRARKGAGRADLLQVTFASVDRQRFLVLSIAHALYDGWSLNLMHRKVQAAYEGKYQPRGLASYVRQVGDVLSAERGDENAAKFWSGFLRDAVPTMIPEGEGNPVQRHVVHRDEAISALDASDIASFCKANAVTLQTLGQACWAALLASKTQSLDVTFGVVLSCRDTEPLEELMFPIMNTVAVRSVLHGTISSWLRYMQDNMTSISPHQHFPLREAQRLAGSNGPLFNTLFIQQRGRLEPGQQEHTALVRSVGGTSAVGYPVCVEIEMKSGNLVWRVACDGAYASRDKTSRMLQELDQTLKHVVRSPEAVVLAFSGQELSICGLAPVMLKAPDDTARATANGLASEDDVWSSLEETIRDVLAEVSGVPAANILRSNNVYHLGLDSISAIKAGSLLRKNGVSVGLRDMLKAGSISEVARLVCDTQPSLSASETPNSGYGSTGGFAVPEDVDLPAILGRVGIDESTIEAVLPALPMQVHVLSVWQNTQGEVFYPCFNYVLSGQVDISTIERAWKSLVAQTPILRTTFVSTNSRSNPVLQLVLRPPTAQQASIIAAGKTGISRAAEDLSQRYHSFQAERHGHTWNLQLKIHHALYDAVSLPAIIERFIALCSGNEVEALVAPAFDWRNVLPPHPLEANRAARKRFWTEYLAGAESLCPCPEYEEQNTSGSRVSIVKRAASRGVFSILKLCRAHGVSLQALFFAAYAEFLASAAVRGGKKKPRRVVFGMYVANRAESNDSRMDFYPLLRLVPLCVALSQGARLLDVAAEIQRDIHEISARVNLEVGLWEVKDWTGITVHSFVNFLGAPTLPSNEEIRQVQLEVAGDASTNPAFIADPPGGRYGDGGPSGLASNPVRDAFPVSIPASFDSYVGDSLLTGFIGCC